MVNAIQNPTPCRSKNGRTRNIGSDGSTNQNVLSECAARRSVSTVSRQSQIMPMIETSGSDAINPPMLGLRRATSEMMSTKTPETIALMNR